MSRAEFAPYSAAPTTPPLPFPSAEIKGETGTMPQITTIIPTFRRPALLARAIRSVLAQAYRHFLICVYDNASGDATAELVRKLGESDGRIRYYCHRENIGLVGNFAFGMGRVETPFFNLLSDDDVLLPGFFDTAVARLTESPEASLFAGTTVRVGRRFIWAPATGWSERVLQPPKGLAEMLARGFPDWNAILFRTALLRSVGSLDASSENAADADFVYRCAANHAMIWSPTVCAALTLHAGSQSALKWTPAYLATIHLRVVERLEENDALRVPLREAFATHRHNIYSKLFLGSLSAAESGQWEKAMQGAEILEREFGAARAASVVRIFASRTLVGAVARASAGAFRGARREIRFAAATRRWRDFRDVLALATEGGPARTSGGA